MSRGDVSVTDILAVIEGLVEKPVNAVSAVDAIDAPALARALDTALDSLVRRHESESRNRRTGALSSR
jgi:hypothetical protein